MTDDFQVQLDTILSVHTYGASRVIHLGKHRMYERKKSVVCNNKIEGMERERERRWEGRSWKRGLGDEGVNVIARALQ